MVGSPSRRAARGRGLPLVRWWHFQNATGLVDNVSTFGDQLRTGVPRGSVRDSGLALGAVWAGGPSTLADPARHAGRTSRRDGHLGRGVLNAVAGAALPAEGSHGPRTKEALRAFQAANGIAQTAALRRHDRDSPAAARGSATQQATFTRIGVSTTTRPRDSRIQRPRPDRIGEAARRRRGRCRGCGERSTIRARRRLRGRPAKTAERRTAPGAVGRASVEAPRVAARPRPGDSRARARPAPAIESTDVWR